MRIINKELNIVVVGGFNPNIITPDWLEHNNLITAKDSKSRSITLINNEVSIFKIPDIEIFTSRERLQLTLKRCEFPELVFDLAIGILTLLIQTPVKNLGINQHLIYDLDSREDRNELGFKLVPPGIWSGILPTYEGMNLLRIQAKRDDDYSGYVWIDVSPVDGTTNQVKFAMNDHYVITGGCEQLIKILSKSFSFDHFESVCNKLIQEQKK